MIQKLKNTDPDCKYKVIDFIAHLLKELRLNKKAGLPESNYLSDP
jgi:hypothetical protein